jgi:hypothetical protein
MTKDTDKRRRSIGSHMRHPTWVRVYNIVGGHSRMHKTRRAVNVCGIVILRRCSNSNISRVSGEYTHSRRTFVVLRVRYSHILKMFVAHLGIVDIGCY